MKLRFIYIGIFLVFAHFQVWGHTIKRLNVTSGLSSDYVLSMAQDKYGFVWLATEEGLDRFDGSSFLTYYKKNTKNSLVANALNVVCDDPKEKIMWIGSQREGLQAYNYDTDQFTTYRKDKKNPNSLYSNDVTDIKPAYDGGLWITTYWYGIDHFDLKTNKFTHYDYTHIKGVPQSFNDCICDLGGGIIAVGHIHGGLTLIDTKNRNSHTFVEDPSNPTSIMGNDVMCVYQDNNGNIWVGTNKGLNLFDRSKGEFVHYIDGGKLSRTIFDIKQVSDGKLWICTEQGGVAIMKPGLTLGLPSSASFQYLNEGYYDNDLSGNTIRCVVEDKFHNVWLGFYASGVNVLLHRAPYFNFIDFSPIDVEHHLTEKSVLSVSYDSHRQLWVGTDGDGVNLFKDGCRVVSDVNLKGKSIQTILEDSEGRLWFGTFSDNAYVRPANGGAAHKIFEKNTDVRCFNEYKNFMFVGTSDGIYIVDKSTLKIVAHYNEFNERLVRTIIHDPRGYLYVGTFGGGLLIFNQQMRIIQKLQEQSDFLNNNVNDLLLDRKGHLWVATDAGIAYMSNPLGRKYTTISSNLNNAIVHAIVEDKQHHIWISTNKGISFYNELDGKFDNYGYQDHIAQGNYNSGCVAISPDGTLYFGSTNGLTYFNPRQIFTKEKAAVPYITQAYVVSNGDEPDSTINLIGKKTLILNHNQNSLVLSVNEADVALNNMVEYSYMINDRDNKWNPVVGNRIYLHNFSHGIYNIKVRCRFKNREWSEPTELRLEIEPPLYLTWWAKLIFAIFVVALIYINQREYTKKLRLQVQLDAEKKKNEQEQKLNEERMHFFTSITHELRTPLTLILGPLDDISRSTEIPDKIKHKLAIIYQSASRLKELINQILEYRKAQCNGRQLNVSKDNIVKAIQQVCVKYQELNTKKKLDIFFIAPESNIPTYFDKGIIIMIMDNLISNAFKYTDVGSITVTVKRRHEREKNLIDIIVSDTGYGISPEALPHIFDSYYQENGKHQASGTGIGLALVKQLVALHQATIQVESKVNKGTTFIVTLDENNFYSTVTYQCGNTEEPLKLTEEHPNDEISSSIIKGNEREQETLIPFDEHEGKPVLLIVEDNEGIRNYITENFEDEYEVVQASNGKEGLALALDRIPDVIISDIMMPIMDGNELLRAVKKDVRTSHIPVLLLTAKDGDQSKIEGYDAGADSYITKPFKVSVLQSRVKNLLNQRRQLIDKIMNKATNSNITIQQKAQELRQAMSESDHAFFEQLNKILDKNITGDLDVNIVAKELGMSASTLYRKMKALTGASTNGYLRHYKMQYAERLLMQGKYTISEIAFMVGINSIAYFRKCFKDEFGCLPSEYLRKISAKD